MMTLTRAVLLQRREVAIKGGIVGLLLRDGKSLIRIYSWNTIKLLMQGHCTSCKFMLRSPQKNFIEWTHTGTSVIFTVNLANVLTYVVSDSGP